jgi:DNA-binding MarR family transcriptional regulator
VSNWSFLTNHGRILLCIAQNPEIRLREIAADLGITERHAFAIVTDLTDAGYVVKQKEGRRNRYQVQNHLALPELPDREQAIGEVLDVLTDRRANPKRTRRAQDAPRTQRTSV